MKIRNNKASRAAVEQYHLALGQCLSLWSKTEGENLRGKKCRAGFRGCDRHLLGAPGRLVLPQQRPRSAACLPGIAPGSLVHPSPVSKPTQDPKKILPTGFEQISSFLLRSSFSRAVGVSGLQHIISALMA